MLPRVPRLPVADQCEEIFDGPFVAADLSVVETQLKVPQTPHRFVQRRCHRTGRRLNASVT